MPSISKVSSQDEDSNRVSIFLFLFCFCFCVDDEFKDHALSSMIHPMKNIF